jgi:hypothetical protein
MAFGKKFETLFNSPSFLLFELSDKIEEEKLW